MEEAILNALKVRSGAFVSGEDLSRLVGVSRTAVWKEIEKLRADGYRILAQPHQGYQLVAAPDRLIPQEITWNLSSERIGRRVYSYATTDSTMDIAHRLATAGEPEGAVVVAESQTKGRGRMGRRWVSPRGKGITLSVLLRPSLVLGEVSRITLICAVSVARAIQESTGLKPQIKWPNDVLVKGKKVAGILTELNAELNQVHYVVVGIGVNVNTAKSHLPAQATSLSEELGTRVDRILLARSLLMQMDRSYIDFLKHGWSSLLESWKGFADFLGQRIRVSLPGRTVEGQAVDVDSGGALLVRTDTGLMEAVSAGEVLVVR